MNAIKPRIPNKNLTLDLLLLHSSPSKIINFFKFNKKFNEILYKNHYIILKVRCYEKCINIIIVQATQIAEQSQFLKK